MVHLEHTLNNTNPVPKPTEEVRRILPEVPKPLPPPPTLPTLQPEPDIVPKPKISPKPNVVGVNQVKSTQGL